MSILLIILPHPKRSHLTIHLRSRRWAGLNFAKSHKTKFKCKVQLVSIPSFMVHRMRMKWQCLLNTARKEIGLYEFLSCPGNFGWSKQQRRRRLDQVPANVQSPSAQWRMELSFVSVLWMENVDPEYARFRCLCRFVSCVGWTLQEGWLSSPNQLVSCVWLGRIRFLFKTLIWKRQIYSFTSSNRLCGWR